MPLRRHRFLIVVCVVFWTGIAGAQDAALLRLGFLLNFARYVEWSEETLKVGEPLRICLASGDAGMSTQLDELPKQSIQGHPLQTRKPNRPGDAGNCHLLYLPAEAPGIMAAWLNAAHQAGALTVSDGPDFVEAGGIIGLAPVGGRYRFDINLGVARQSRLRLSSQLLKLARTVK